MINITVEKNKILFINDAYNASPVSMKMALNAFSSLPLNKKKIVVLGDALELGDKEIEYLNKNLFILSALYGAISPNTEIKPYRLDMTINILDESMYKFWSKDINSYLDKYSTEIFINLASKEFSKILDYKKFKVIDIEFRQNIDGKLKNISTEGKKARGMMLNYLIEHHIEDIKQIKEIVIDDYHFSENDSNDDHWVFIKNEKNPNRVFPINIRVLPI